MKRQKRQRVGSSDDEQISTTQLFRTHAVWFVPGVLLTHALFIYGLSGQAATATLALAVPGALAGWTVRRMKRATAVLAIQLVVSGFLFLYVCGVLPAMNFWALTGRKDLIPASGLFSIVGIVALLSWRIRASLREDWSRAIESGPGVLLDPRSGTLDRLGEYQAPMHVKVAAGVAIPFFMTLLLAGRETGWYVIGAMLIMPLLIPLICTDAVARLATFFWVFRRWEIEHGVRLQLPTLAPRKKRRRKPRRPKQTAHLP